MFFCRIMLPELEKSLDDINVIANLFIRRKEDMKVKYGKFCINQPKAEFVMAQFEEFFNVSLLLFTYSPAQFQFYTKSA